ncbi:GAF and ANTAR domain-containing protein [Pseudonocardia sp. KRD291]|uniref:GAF and ANTAR domain-containing protein n=1 Tax=Pseudonocardia sp. KRD291 TaxID=2792007 RepID=UPI001C5C1E48|nr:GAF and ANTAR domain-containing protein [Pseudonocardia sp. KRD291]MBW0101341.1 GAF and ANTAR domain-containing protein [Pseudonocardia sp. KRD291]
MAVGQDRGAAAHEPEKYSGEDLVAAMDNAAHELLRNRGDVTQAARQIVVGAISVIPPATDAGISLVEHDRTVRSYAPSSVVVDELDRLQNELGEGPCLDAIHQETRVEIPDMAAETRWPRWAAAARERGVGSLLSFQLFARDGSAGALNLYALGVDAFDSDAHHLGGLFAAHAAVTVFGVQEIAHLTRALDSRDEIGQAKGILMERFTMTADQAFALLVRTSSETNVKLASVAHFLAAQATERATATAED